MEKNSRIYVAGNRGLVGSAIERRLRRDHETLITSDIADFDLTDARATDAFFARTQPEYVFLAAAKVGGIKANDTYPADFIRINLQIQTNLIDAAFRHKARKLLFLGSSCIYPKLAPQPLKEEYLLTGKLEPTNDAYAIAKIAGILMCKSYNRQHGTNFIAAMPTNLYGPGDNFDLQTSHVLPAWIRKFHEAKRTGRDSVELWGTGNVRRELLYVEDLADALVFLMNHFDAGREREDEEMFVNIGLGEDIVLRDLAELVRGIVGYSGGIVWNTAMPDGTPRKLLDVGRLHALGWKAQHTLEAGIRKTYAWYLENLATNVR
jgi:GDP-L-fucose synthase